MAVELITYTPTVTRKPNEYDETMTAIIAGKGNALVIDSTPDELAKTLRQVREAANHARLRSREQSREETADGVRVVMTFKPMKLAVPGDDAGVSDEDRVTGE